MASEHTPGPPVLYEVINPSDPVTFIAPTFEAAFLATILVGNGYYAAKPIDADDAPEVPMFLFGTFGQWFAERFPGQAIGGMMDAHRSDTIAALRSFCTGSATDRKLYDAALAAITDADKRASFLADWDDRKRTSLSDIANSAHHLAATLSRSPTDD